MSFPDTDAVDDALSGTALSAQDLHAIWGLRQPVPEPAAARKEKGRAGERQIPWLQDSVDRLLRFTERALGAEEFLLVCDAAREALRHWGEGGGDDATRAALVRVRM